nr:hypothetical protein [uncultured bacterium]
MTASNQQVPHRRPDVPALRLEGSWFEKGSSTAVPATLTMQNAAGSFGRIDLHSGGKIDVVIARVSDRIGSIPRTISMVEGGSFSTTDNDAADQLANPGAGRFSRMSKWEAFHPRLIAFLVAALVLIVAFVTYGLPVVAKIAAWATPPQVVAWMDSSALSTIDRLMVNKSTLDPDRQQKLKTQFENLAALSKHNGQLELYFRDGGRMGANAFALPGGSIVVTDQLARLTTDEEIVAVLAHEIAHVQNEHSLQQLYRALGFAGIVAIIAGDLGSIGEEILSGGGVLVAMAASRGMELEADSEAVALLKKTDIDPINLSTALDKLYKSVCGENIQDCEASGWFSSHPGGEERRKALRDRISQND